MSSPQIDIAEIEALRKEIDRLAPDEIRALQGFGIQQAARNGLLRDARLIILFGIIAAILGLISPVYPILKGIQILGAIVLTIGAIKAYFRPTLDDMRILVIFLGASVIMNALTGIVNVLLSEQLVLAIFLIALASIEGRWAMNLWQSYQVAKQSDADVVDYPLISELYLYLAQALSTTPPRPDNGLINFDGNQAMRLLPARRFAVALSRNGMMQVVQAEVMKMQVNPDTEKGALHFEVAFTFKKRVYHGKVSQISYDNFQKWQKSVS